MDCVPHVLWVLPRSSASVKPSRALADLPDGSVGQPPAHLSHDVGAGPAMPTAVAHFYEIQAAGTLGEVSEFCEVPAGGWFLWG